MKKENENLIYEIVKREFKLAEGGNSEYLFEVTDEDHKLKLTRKFLGRTITKKYSGKDILKLIKKCDNEHQTLFSVLLNEFSFKSNPERMKKD